MQQSKEGPLGGPREKRAVLALARDYLRGPLGFGFFFTWFYSCFNTTVLAASQSVVRFLEIAWAVSMLAAIAVSLCSLAYGSPPSASWGYLGVAGMFLVYLSVWLPAPFVAAAVGLVMIGVGMAAGMMSWVRVLSCYDSLHIEWYISASFLLCFLLYQGISLAGGFVGLCLLAMLLLASEVLLSRSLRRDMHSVSRLRRPLKEAFALTTAEVSAIAFVATLFMGTVVVRMVVLGTSETIHEGYSGVLALTSFVLLPLLFFVIIRFSADAGYSLVYRWATPAIFLACACCGLGTREGRIGASILNALVLFAVHFALWATIAKGARQGQDGGLAFICWGVFAFFFGKVVGVAAGFGTMAAADGAYASALLFLVAVVAAVVAATARRASSLLSEPARSAAPLKDERSVESLDSLFAEQAAIIAQEHKLSKREEEVLALLLAGRNRPYIRDELMVSINTINTYVRRIFTKLDVHSQQEVIDLMRDSLPTARAEDRRG